MQAEGGFVGDLHASVRAALVAWEKKRESNKGFRYGHGSNMYRKEKTATASRSEISWNSAPEVVRAPCPRKKAERTQAQREARNKALRESKAKETSEQRRARLDARNAWYRARVGEKPKRPKMSIEERRASLREAKKRYQERLKAGLVSEKPKSKLTPQQLAAKAARARRYYQQNKQNA
jgi:hypothetical protein